MHIRRNISIMPFFKHKTYLYNIYQIKLHKTSICLWPVYLDMFDECFFSDLFINQLPKIHRSVLHKIAVDLLYFSDIYDVSLWEKLAITIKLCFIETRLKQDSDLRGYFLKITREVISALTILVIHYVS